MRFSTLLLFIVLAATASAAPSLTETDVSFGEILPQDILTRTFTLENDGDAELTNIDLSSSAASKYQVDFTPDSVASLAPGAEVSIEVSMFMPYGETVADSVLIGDIKANADEADFVIGDLLANIHSFLELNRVRVEINSETQSVSQNGEAIEEPIQPQDSITVFVEVENVYDSQRNLEIDIDNAIAKITIPEIDIDNDDLEIESDDVTLEFEGNERKETFEFTFDIPEEAEEGQYGMEIEVTGEDDDGNDFTILWILTLDVERNTHELVLRDYNVNPSNVRCGQETVISFEIANLGQEDEDYVRYTVKNAALGLNIELSRFEITSDVEDNEYIYPVSLPFTVGNVAEGAYAIETRIYRDFDVLEDVSGLNLIVSGCGAATPTQPSAPTPTQTTPAQPKPSQSNQTPTQAVQPVYDVRPTISKDVKSSNMSVLGLPFLRKEENRVPILIGIVAALLLAIGVLLFLPKKK